MTVDDDFMGDLDSGSDSATAVATPEAPDVPESSESQAPERSGVPSDQAQLKREPAGHGEPRPSSPHDEIPETAGSAPQIPDELMQRASAYGYTPEDLQAWGDVEAIETVLREQDRLAFQQWQHQQQQQRFMPPPQSMPPAYPPQYPPTGMPYPQQFPPPGYPGAVQQQFGQPQPGQAGQQQTPPWMYQVDLDPNVYDERLVQHMQGMSQHYAQQIGALQQQFQQAMGAFAGQMQQRQQQEAEQQLARQWSQFDQLIESLGPAYQPVFGKGNWQTLGQQTGSPFGRNRTEVYQRMQSLRDFYSQRGGPQPDERRLLEMAAEDALQGQWKAIQQKVGKSSGRTGQTIARPRGATGTRQPQGERAAADLANQFFRERGYDIKPASFAENEEVGL